MALTNSNASNHSNGVPTVKETIHNYVHDIKSQIDRLPDDAAVVKSLIDGIFTEGVVDDRQ
jgi:hypothetical protein